MASEAMGGEFWVQQMGAEQDFMLLGSWVGVNGQINAR